MVGGTGLEPVTPTMSKWCATTAPTARFLAILTQNCLYYKKWRRHPDLNWGMEVLQTSALPLGYAAGMGANKFRPYKLVIRIYFSAFINLSH
jgi:hypothetical protein